MVQVVSTVIFSMKVLGLSLLAEWQCDSERTGMEDNIKEIICAGFLDFLEIWIFLEILKMQRIVLII